MTQQVPVDACLHCQIGREEIKREGYFCAIVSRGEYTEIEAEFPRHRFKDWTDRALEKQGVKPEAFERHRRTSVNSFQWIACEDTVHGHRVAKKDDREFGIRRGQCWKCGRQVEDAEPVPDIPGFEGTLEALNDLTDIRRTS